jgi:hypothetical protein
MKNGVDSVVDRGNLWESMQVTPPKRKMAQRKPKDPSKMVMTLNYQIKDASEKKDLGNRAGAVNTGYFQI